MSGGSGGSGSGGRSGGGGGGQDMNYSQASKIAGDQQFTFSVESLSNREIEDLRAKLPYTSQPGFRPSSGATLAVNFESRQARKNMLPEAKKKSLETMRKAENLLKDFAVMPRD